MFRRLFVIVFVFMALVSCHEKVPSPYKNISRESFADMFEPAFELNSHEIRRCIDTLMRADGVRHAADRRTKRYYSDHRPFIWIDRNGACLRADTALARLRESAKCGLDTNKLRTGQIAEDLKRLRCLDVFGQGRGINKTMARLEYNLTRAYMRYSAGQKFGFVNPDKLYNNLEKCDSDTVTGRVQYSRLTDLRVRKPDSLFFETAVRKAFNDSVGEFLASVQPHGALYKALVERLNDSPASSAERNKILCNIERCRWTQRGYTDFHDYKKYVVVNIPSFTLRAVSVDSVLSMRVAVGALKTKTPLLTSSIMRMDINPQWIIPKSIARGIAGRTGYMHREDMFIMDKKRGKLPPEAVSYSRLMDGEQYIVQAGGAKNPLGRIIFRFANNFSVYLHDTSSPWLFQRSCRTLSHGCVRVEKPLELAMFMLGNPDRDIQEKLRYSMTMSFPNDNDSIKKVHVDRDKIINSVKVEPAVPVFITYYTVFYGIGGNLVSFDDVYGYDDALAEELSPFVK